MKSKIIISRCSGTVHVMVNEVLSAPKGKYCIVRLVSGFDSWKTDYGACVPSVCVLLAD